LVIKSGFVVWGASGSGSGSTRLTQPRRMLPFWGGLGAAPAELARVFVARACLEDDSIRRSLPSGHRYAAISHTRGLSSLDMLLNTATPKVEVSLQPEPVRIDGSPVEIHRATHLPLTRAHQLA
jgi:urease subunit alpha